MSAEKAQQSASRPSPSFEIREASTDSDIQSFAALTQAYHRFLNTEFGLDLAFQNFEQEIANLPGAYSAPAGKILVVTATIATSQDEQSTPVKGAIVGAIALRPFSAMYIHDSRTVIVDWALKTCELKRLYVLPNWSGYGLGRLLVQSALVKARMLGYQKVILDSLTGLKAANHIYRKLGFTACSSYNGNPLADVCFWEMLLTDQEPEVNKESKEKEDC